MVAGSFGEVFGAEWNGQVIHLPMLFAVKLRPGCGVESSSKGRSSMDSVQAALSFELQDVAVKRFLDQNAGPEELANFRMEVSQATFTTTHSAPVRLVGSYQTLLRRS